MRRAALPVLLCLTLLAACAAHEKAGDRAAAVGDWKTAEREYAEAARKDPKKAEVQEKYRRARAAAIEGSAGAARACAAGADWECALAEASYVLGLDPAHLEMATLRPTAAREAGRLRLRRAGEAVDRREHAHALQLLLSAREVTDDPGVAAEARRLQPAAVSAAIAEADRHRAAQQYPKAVELLALATRVDPAVAPRLEKARAEYERWKDQEAERLAREGDGLMEQRRFGEAKAAYDAAAQLRPQGRAAGVARYADRLAAGEAAAARGDFAAAETAFAEAARSPADAGRGWAAAELDRVKVRPYQISLRSVLVRPVRPDGYPWAGDRSRALDRVLARAGAGLDLPVNALLDLSRVLPGDNLPALVVTVGLPDGRGLQTAPRRGIFSRIDGSFVVLSNAYDDRVIGVRVSSVGSGPTLDVGTPSFRLGDLVAAGDLSLADGSVAELRVGAEPADRPEGTIAGFAPVPDPTNTAPDASLPGPGARGFRLTAVEVTLASADRPGPVDLVVEIEQGRRLVYRSPVERRASGAAFRPGATFLFVGPGDQLLVRVTTRGAAGTTPVLVAPVTADALERGTVDLAAPRGSTVRLRVEPRRHRAGAARA
jgi:tetratricopeptide (TPR) repeat protein